MNLKLPFFINETYLCMALILFFGGLVAGGWNSTFVPLGDHRRLTQVLNGNFTKNNHAIATLYYTNLDKENFVKGQNDLIADLKNIPLRNMVADYRIQDIYIHSLMGRSDVGEIETCLNVLLNEEILNPFRDSQNFYVLLLIHRSGNLHLIQRMLPAVKEIEKKTRNPDVKMLALAIINGDVTK